MSEIVIAIPTRQPERAAELIDLLTALRAQLPVPVITVGQAAGETGLDNYLRAWRLAAVEATEWIIQLDDDVWLAPTFGATVRAALASEAAQSVGAVTFYSNSTADLACLARGEHWRRVPPPTYYNNQCLAVRAALVAPFLDYCPRWHIAHPEHRCAPDLAFGSFMAARRAPILAYIPSQAQHRVSPSLLGHHGGRRRSRSYEAAYGADHA